MDTHSLQAFVMVAETASFSEAANRLFLTQSAISKRIALLEQQLNCRLFDRIGRHVKMTEAGQRLLPKARDIQLALKDAETLVNNLNQQVSGRLSFAASHHISLHRLPPLLKHYAQSFPEVELDLRFDESEMAYERVLKGDIELALITLAPEADPRICSEQIWDDRLFYVVSCQHPLAQSEHVTLAALNAYPALLPRPETFTHQLVRQQMSAWQLEPNLGMSTNYLDTIRMMVSIGLGWSLLPETLIDDQLTRLQLDAAPIHRPLGYIYHRDRTLSNAAQQMVRLLQQHRDGTQQQD
ncbi:MAG: LysR family transcriptional regulator [Nitrincola lacisaponensis]|uniref:Cys regulon transcriptional activator CysB n=1 Tax=Nitrincola lacisaponensis TaxID=267850 RepID=A0A063Y255_9GAMM|nr:LysR family transcriptional regulator [Nitrincola lacisaponensis]KDE38592.1 Cys regulon transcriptional activator CysB [Nitrincola lacisaponensis]